ncbi:DUF4232 domain-containing protein [Streptomyces sp. NPDC096033]|uniref:DUF4232 domain-containing protein n=1 Tax=Streptomyces sp. NPDC096033 TaxID=3366071 RepID=UPI00381B024D
MADDLSSALRDLADSAARPAPTTGAEIRRRAVSRRRRRHSALAGGTVAVVAGLAFGLTTALGGPESHRHPAPPPAASLSAATTDAASPSAPAAPTAPTASTPSSTDPSPTPPTLAGPNPTGPNPTAGSASSPAPEAVGACAVGDLGFSAANEDEEGKPVRHLLLTVTNNGNRKCSLYEYPYLKFPYARAPIAVIKDSKDAPATLAPGESAYAALLASGGRMDTYDTNTLPLSLQGPGPGGKPGGPVDVGLPGQVSFDDGARVTYWTTASGLALRFIMSS